MTDLKQVEEALEKVRNVCAAKNIPPEEMNSGVCKAHGCLPCDGDGCSLVLVYQALTTLRELENKVLVDGWQPMNTAPKDGTEILVWRDDSGSFIARHTDGYGVIPEHEQDEEWCTEETLEHEGWWSDAYGWQEGPETPTHWMPIPTGPDLHHRKEENESD